MAIHHQRIHHASRSFSPHDSPPRHSPPHDPHYPYHTPYAPSAASRSPCPHCHAPATGFHADPSAGDLVCTQCGAVLDDHLRDATAEWREFNNDEDMARGKGPGMRSRCGAAVDESKFVGGVMPTRVGATAYTGGSGSGAGAGTSDEKHRLALVRNRLKRTHNMIENMVEMEQRGRYREVVLERRAAEARAARGERDLDGSRNDDGDGWAQVSGDYEGLMAARGDAVAPNRKRRAIAAKAPAPPSDAERVLSAVKDEKWSLPDAVLLHGTVDEAQHWVPCQSGEEWTESALDAARAQRLKQIRRKEVAASLPSLYMLYLAFAILDRAARKLDLAGNTASSNQCHREAVAWLVKFATRRDGLRIKGVAGSSSSSNIPGDPSSLSLSLFDVETFQRILDGAARASSKKSTAAARMKDARQCASLGAAIVYLVAKRRGVGRTLTEVCAAFGTYAVMDDHGAGGAGEPLVRPKHCSRAMLELRTALPEVVSVPSSASSWSSPPPSSSVKREEAQARPAKVTPSYDGAGTNEDGLRRPSSTSSVSTAASPLPVKSEYIPEHQPTESNNAPNRADAEERALADLVSRMASSLGLPPAAAAAAAAVALRCARDAAPKKTNAPAPPNRTNGRGHIRPTKRRRLGSARGGDAPDVIAASSLLLVCAAGGAMQRLARQALESHPSSAIQKPDGQIGAQLKHEKAFGGVSGEGRGSGFGSECSIGDPLDELIDEQIPSPSGRDDPSLMTSSSDITAQHDTLSSWRAWKDQPPWHRDASQLEQATGIARKKAISYYSTIIHPRRSSLLEAALRGLEGGDLQSNIAAAVPLISLRNL